MVRSPILFAPDADFLLIDAVAAPRVIPSQFQQGHRFGGSGRISADDSLWMNLWKLCIAVKNHGDCCCFSSCDSGALVGLTCQHGSREGIFQCLMTKSALPRWPTYR